MIALTSERARGFFLQQTFDFPVFSFFFRLHGGSDKQPHDLNHIKSQIRDYVKNSPVSEVQKDQAIEKADELLSQIQEHAGAKSISLFVAQNEGELHHHFVYLPERQYCGKQFALAEYLWAEQMSQRYLLVLAGPSAICLYEGKGLALEKLGKCAHSEKFVSAFKHWHEKRDVKHGAGTAKTEPVIEAFVELVQNLNAPVLLIGKEFLPDVCSALSSANLQIHGAFTGNKVDSSPAELQTTLDEYLQLCTKEDTNRQIARCEQSLRQFKLATGAQEILDCAKEARGSVLLLEPPTREGGSCLLDSVQESIRQTVLNGGQVHFVMQGALEQWGGAALILRF